MTTPSLFVAKEYLYLWTQLDKLCNDGQGDSAEADALRDKMDPLWYADPDGCRLAVEGTLTMSIDP